MTGWKLNWDAEHLLGKVSGVYRGAPVLISVKYDQRVHNYPSNTVTSSYDHLLHPARARHWTVPSIDLTQPLCNSASFTQN